MRGNLENNSSTSNQEGGGRLFGTEEYFIDRYLARTLFSLIFEVASWLLLQF